MKFVYMKFLISLSLLITIFSLFYMGNSHIVRKNKSCKSSKNEVAEVIVIKKDQNGEIISREKTTYPQRGIKENQGKLIPSIKLTPIKKVKKMQTKLKSDLTNLLKDKVPKKITKSNDDKNAKLTEAAKLAKAAKLAVATKLSKATNIILKQEKKIEVGKKKIDKNINSMEKKDNKMENNIIKIDNLKNLVNQPKEKLQINKLVQKVIKNNSKLEQKVTNKIPKIINKMEKATDKIVENNQIKNMKTNEQKEVVKVFKNTFEEGSNFVKIGNKEVTEARNMMHKGLADSGFKMLNMGHQNIQKGMKIILKGRTKLNAVTKKLDEVDKEVNNKSVVKPVQAAGIKIKKVKRNKKPEIKSTDNSSLVNPVMKTEVKKEHKPKKFNPILAMIRKAEDKSKKTS